VRRRTLTRTLLLRHRVERMCVLPYGPPVAAGIGFVPVCGRLCGRRNGANLMLHYAIVFLVIALIAGVLGFGGIAGSAVGIAKILFLIFIVLFVVSLLLGRRGRL
jgi:uncharacterized membrane protein YtjA (UPF0391 family)